MFPNPSYKGVLCLLIPRRGQQFSDKYSIEVKHSVSKLKKSFSISQGFWKQSFLDLVAGVCVYQKPRGLQGSWLRSAARENNSCQLATSGLGRHTKISVIFLIIPRQDICYPT